MTTDQQVEALTVNSPSSGEFKAALANSCPAVLRHVLVYRRLSRPAQRAILKRLLELKPT